MLWLEKQINEDETKGKVIKDDIRNIKEKFRQFSTIWHYGECIYTLRRVYVRLGDE